jgi:ribosomal protein S18 acetylase RimI-like enzyme
MSTKGNLEELTLEQAEASLLRSKQEYSQALQESYSLSETDSTARTHEQFEQILPEGISTSGHLFFGWKVDGQVLGTAWLRLPKKTSEGSSVFIYDLWVTPSERGKGLGKEILEALKANLRAKGLSKMGLHVFSKNERAIRLYQKLGFQVKSLNMEWEW